MFLGILLIGIGIVILAVQFGILSGSVANLIWPVLAIFVGVWLLVVKRDGTSFTGLGGGSFGANGVKKGNRK